MPHEWRRWLGLGAALLALVGSSAPVASAAATGWEFEAATYDFGPQLAGGTPTEHAFVLTNTGETRITRILWGIRWWGGLGLDSNLFRLSDTSGCRTLEPGASCSVSVAFAPLTVGQKQGEVWASSSTGEPSATGVELLGLGGSPYVAIQPESVNLGSVEVGKTSPPRTITIQDQGNVGLLIHAVSLSDVVGAPMSSGPFRIVGGTCLPGVTVAAGGTCTVQVTLMPTEAGSPKARLAIADDAPESPQSIELHGTATAVPILTASAPTPTKKKKLVCPKGKQKVTVKGKRVCVRKKRHHR